MFRNRERLENHRTGKENIGIKGANLDEFNQNVTKIKKINPNSVKHRNGVTKFASRYGKNAVIAGGVGGVLGSTRDRGRKRVLCRYGERCRVSRSADPDHFKKYRHPSRK